MCCKTPCIIRQWLQGKWYLHCLNCRANTPE